MKHGPQQQRVADYPPHDRQVGSPYIIHSAQRDRLSSSTSCAQGWVCGGVLASHPNIPYISTRCQVLTPCLSTCEIQLWLKPQMSIFPAYTLYSPPNKCPLFSHTLLYARGCVWNLTSSSTLRFACYPRFRVHVMSVQAYECQCSKVWRAQYCVSISVCKSAPQPVRFLWSGYRGMSPGYMMAITGFVSTYTAVFIQPMLRFLCRMLYHVWVKHITVSASLVLL